MDQVRNLKSKNTAYIITRNILNISAVWRRVARPAMLFSRFSSSPRQHMYISNLILDNSRVTGVYTGGQGGPSCNLILENSRVTGAYTGGQGGPSCSLILENSRVTGAYTGGQGGSPCNLSSLKIPYHDSPPVPLVTQISSKQSYQTDYSATKYVYVFSFILHFVPRPYSFFLSLNLLQLRQSSYGQLVTVLMYKEKRSFSTPE